MYVLATTAIAATNVAGIVRSLGRSTPDLVVVGCNCMQFRSFTATCEETVCLLSVIPGKEAKGITKCGDIERKDQGHTAMVILVLFSGPSALSAQTHTLIIVNRGRNPLLDNMSCQLDSRLEKIYIKKYEISAPIFKMVNSFSIVAIQKHKFLSRF